ncbi:ORF_36 [Catopsilia pomona nucleopolyhedrovirus]|uniref:ORF_36 n=1 Tax=Catopsilia pomona nucleopolyhedrovirus TaxID=1850906 RepID=A0A172WZB3_9ABAC|nr:ORF_36 [Catopsilia pomona nucleopolyhedrovirus]ANF29684.1 ORF_36 [Catopsilia pomona nucleopolyhedrovirus]
MYMQQMYLPKIWPVPTMYKNLHKRFALLFVWHHDNQFVCNTHTFPFWHNIQYHSREFDCILVHCIENDNGDNNKRVQTLAFENIISIDFKQNYRKAYNDCIKKTKRRACKIDWMKLIIMLDPQSLNVPYEYLLLMDMDCVVQSIDWRALFTRNYCYEPFYDSSVDVLYATKRNDCANFDSYLENYATLIRTKQVLKHESYLNLHRANVLADTGDYNSSLFKQYIKMICNIYFDVYNYKIPQLYKDLTLTPCVSLSFRRGGSWKIKRLDWPRYDYVYNYNVKPSFFETNLCRQLYALILTSSNVTDDVYAAIENLKRLNYDFSSKFEWSNSLQCYVNVYGVLCDRYCRFDVSNHTYLLPLKMYNSNNDDDDDHVNDNNE